MHEGMQKTKLTVLLFCLLAGVVLWQWQVMALQTRTGKVERVLNGKSFVLDDGQVVRLASIQVPNIQETDGLKRPGQPMGVQSHQALIDLVQNQPVTLSFGPEIQDRKGRLLALAALADGRSVQEEMIKQGWAMVYPFPDLVEVLPKWLKLEAEARNAKRGIWQNSYWDPQDADGVDTGGEERFLLVEGTVRSVGKAKGGWFINFDDDWKTDFTAVIDKDDARAYFKNYDVKGLRGRKVRVRGWTYRHNGPAMDINQPEQIEILK